jgi:hypothetical protein
MAAGFRSRGRGKIMKNSARTVRFEMFLLLLVPLTGLSQTAVPLTNRTAWFLSGLSPASYSINFDKSRFCKKSPSLHAVFTGSNGFSRDFGTYMTTMDAAGWEEKRIRLSGYIKTSNVLEHAACWMRIDRSDGSSSAFDNMADRSASGTTGWRKFAIVLDAASNSGRINFGLILKGEGEVWASDLVLEAVDRNMPVTDLWSLGTNRYTSGGLPRNLGFETGDFSFWYSFNNPDSGIVTNATHSGRYAGLLVRPDYPGKNICGVGQNFFNPEYSGKRIRISGFLRTFSSASAAFEAILSRNPDNTDPLDGDSFETAGFFSWTNGSLILDVPALAGNLCLIIFSANGSGKIEFDDFKIEVLGDAFPIIRNEILNPVTDMTSRRRLCMKLENFTESGTGRFRICAELLTNSNRWLRYDALNLLWKTAGTNFGFNPDLSTAQNRSAVVRWKAWTSEADRTGLSELTAGRKWKRIGICVSSLTNGLPVIGWISENSEVEGLYVNDMILEIDGRPMQGLLYDEVVRNELFVRSGDHAVLKIMDRISGKVHEVTVPGTPNRSEK